MASERLLKNSKAVFKAVIYIGNSNSIYKVRAMTARNSTVDQFQWL